MNTDLPQKYDIEPFYRAFRERLKQRIGNKKSPLVILQGGVGKQNTGDDTLMLVAREQVLKACPDARVFALCYDPLLIKRQYGVDGLRYKSAESIRYLLRCDALVLPAGGLVNDLTYNAALKRLFNPRGKFVFVSMLLTAIRHKFVAVFGVGIHDFPDPVTRFLARIALPRVDMICIRDRASAGYLEKIGCKNYFFAHDPVITYRGKLGEDDWQGYKQREGIGFDRFIVLNFRAVKDERLSQSVEEELAKFLQEFHAQRPQMGVLLIPFCVDPFIAVENDVTAMEELLDKAYERDETLKDACMLVRHYLTADEAKLICQHAKLLVLARHHALILSYEYQIPTIALSYNRKCRGFAELAEYKYVFDYPQIKAEKLLAIAGQEFRQREEICTPASFCTSPPK